jgi:hypothetical protein
MCSYHSESRTTWSYSCSAAAAVWLSQKRLVNGHLQSPQPELLRLPACVLPQALLATYTTAVVRHNSSSGETVARPLGRAAYVAQLNAALRQAASNRQVPLVDYERMSSGLGFDQYLSDNTHPNDEFMLQALNLYLNMYEQRRRCWALPAQVDPSAGHQQRGRQHAATSGQQL